MFQKTWRVLSDATTTPAEWAFLIWLIGSFIGIIVLTFLNPFWVHHPDAFFLEAYLGTLVVCSTKYIVLRFMMGFTQIED